MLNELKINFYSAKVYLKEVLLFDLFFLLFIFYFVKSPHLITLLVIFLFLLSLFFFNIIGKKRLAELEQVKVIINNIRKNIYENPDDIKMSPNLRGMEDEIKKMFEKERSDIAYLKKLEQVRTQFLANVSHELRTPIFAIQGYIETLLNGAIDDKQVNRYFLEKANQRTISLSNLLNDLIDISMIESGEMRMSYRYFNIDEYLKPLIQDFEPMAKEKNIDLVYHPLKKNLQLFGDKSKLRQVFVNLLTNAIKYTEKGKVEVLIEEDERYAKIIIRDTGIGIPEEDINRVFERFYRVDKARSRAVGGTGLGLAIVKHIIEAHGSKIEVQSKLDEGTEFSFRLKK